MSKPCFYCNNDDPYLIDYLGLGIMFCQKCQMEFNIQGDDMSKGKEVIGTFNVSDKSEVDLIKEKASELIDLIDKYGVEERRKNLAIDHIEAGTMFAVKSLFH